MFEFEHKIEFQDSDTIELFGQDHFGDKSTFGNFHQTRLKVVCDKLCMTGFPIKISDLQFDKHQVIKDKNEFDVWLKKNQPFECKCSDKNNTKEKIFHFKENKRILKVLKLNIEKVMYFKTLKLMQTEGFHTIINMEEMPAKFKSILKMYLLVEIISLKIF
ncbi:hypothetical protein Celal_3228 [Cellulophaga algicola DSM 14237]|uniref:Uncharacterized protein n=1 Tax=Cellulophaga algicola (strain DSM 14237 / IC166 / ACAM 630) TaxID=688270 RepID=E6X5E4_CELAD|nr:hypothetical protein [Cellulophaga algicola]ADV50499.1 hypothetical protein Celal_3228 [Cellulophaga algicola DSM 14237]